MHRLAPLIPASILAACVPMPPGGYPVAHGQRQPTAQATARPVAAGLVEWEFEPSSVAALATQVSAADMQRPPSDYPGMGGALLDAGGGRRVLLASGGPWTGPGEQGFAVFVDDGGGRYRQAGAGGARGALPRIVVVPVSGNYPSFRITGVMFDPRQPRLPERQRTATLRYDQAAGKYIEASR